MLIFHTFNTWKKHIHTSALCNCHFINTFANHTCGVFNWPYIGMMNEYKVLETAKCIKCLCVCVCLVNEINYQTYFLFTFIFVKSKANLRYIYLYCGSRILAVQISFVKTIVPFPFKLSIVQFFVLLLYNLLCGVFPFVLGRVASITNETVLKLRFLLRYVAGGLCVHIPYAVRLKYRHGEHFKIMSTSETLCHPFFKLIIFKMLCHGGWSRVLTYPHSTATFLLSNSYSSPVFTRHRNTAPSSSADRRTCSSDSAELVPSSWRRTTVHFDLSTTVRKSRCPDRC